MKHKFALPSLSWKLILTVIFLFIFFLGIFKLLENNALSIQFIDEDDNFVTANYMLKGEKLYQDIFSQHQPLTYIISVGIEKITHPNSIFLLVKRHREALIAFSLLFDLILFLRFRYKSLPFIIGFETLKILMLGNLFLAESFSAYPVAYLTLTAFEKKKLKLLESFLIGILAASTFFLLAPLWPLLIILTIIISYNQRNLIKKFVPAFAFGFLIVTAFVFMFASLHGYIHDAILINLKYYIPLTNTQNTPLIAGLFSPLLAFLPSAPSGQIIWPTRALLLVVFLISYYLIKNKKYLEAVFIYLLLGLANLRAIPVGGEIYSGFHLLPWFGILLASIGYFSDLLFKQKTRYFSFALYGLCLILLLFSVKQFLPKRDIAHDLYVNYSRQSDTGQAIAIMKNENDTLFVKPAQSLIYWQAEIKHALPLTYDYGWEDAIPEFSAMIEQMFKTNPPTFVYCECLGKNYTPYALGNYAGKYTELQRDGNGSRLFVLNKKMEKVNEEQKSKLSFFHYSFPLPANQL